MQILSELNPIQQAAVVYDIDKPLLILAGAGSGKTRVLTYRAAYMISDKKVDSQEILLLTFTNKAAQEMTKRVKVLLKQDFGGYGGTYHSFCAKLLRRYGAAAGIDENFVIFDEADQLDTVKQAMARLGFDNKAIRPNSVLKTISDAKNNLVEPYDYTNYARGNFQQTVAKIYLTYQQLLKKYRGLDFDDLLLEAVKLLINYRDIKEKISQKFQYLLVDEYQDTNKAQYEITREISMPGNKITVVGDAAQAIYSWRGADYRNLMYLKRDFPGLETINLEQNYRSTQVILSAANKVVSKNKNHPILKLWTEKKGGEKIFIYEAESELEEANFVINKILNAHNLQLNYSDFAVLYRTNAQSRVLEEAMLSAGIPYVLVGGVRFYERKEIKDILAYLRLIINPDEEVSRKRAEKNGKNKLRKFDERFMNYDLQINTLGILDEVIKVTEYLDQYDPENQEDYSRLENIKELRSVADQYPNLTDFLEQVALTEKESKVTAKEYITLMTLHSAKGLEFKTVFIVGMEEGLFPHSRTLMDHEQLEEERRLCYVGMTRAMDKLYLTYAKRRLYFGTRSSNMVSRFLGDIPEELISTDRNGYNGLKNKHIGEGYGFDSKGNWKWKPEE